MKKFSLNVFVYVMLLASISLMVACGGDTATEETTESTAETESEEPTTEEETSTEGEETSTEGEGTESTESFEAPFANDSSYELTALYISSTEAEEWGENLLPEDYADETFQLAFPAEGTYDVKIVDDEGKECIVDAVELKSGVEFHLTNEDGLFECFGE